MTGLMTVLAVMLLTTPQALWFMLVQLLNVYSIAPDDIRGRYQDDVQLVIVGE